ncbi:glycerophosphodiester phosphodiesterase [Temperatibacter marinus]|uniref:Glycerophosphodiester phosphodiesterase n=1 Tax=Temperatibacter marinus TaxID=1456591 RepID=A0AA52HAM2_9PROT|nr:glycerophosphodiester phosphodiesterase [Temperatibacter marinus]WND02753.1 glycerophosphodiester phosphodiesterase [Temperatibacter marinus]
MKKSIKAITFLFITILVLSLVIAILSIDHVIDNKATTAHFFYNNCKKIWSHRGYTQNTDQNSIEAMQAAIDLSAPGLEIDVFFDKDHNEFIVSHDYPYNLKNGEILKLETVLQKFGNSIYYWLDFKNLSQMSKTEALEALEGLTKLDKAYQLKTRTLLESKNTRNLSFFTQSNFPTSYWFTHSPDASVFRFWIDTYKAKIKYLYGDFSAISMDYRQYSTRLKNALGEIPILLWTVNDSPLLSTYLNDRSVKIILTDEQFFDINKCSL